MPNIWIRTAFSLAVALGLAGASAAQDPPGARPSPYGAISPWPALPTRGNPIATTPSAPPSFSKLPTRPVPEPPRTLYYKKDKNASGVVAAAAAEIAPPVAAEQPKKAEVAPPLKGEPGEDVVAPTREELFRLESESALESRVNATKKAEEKIKFPERDKKLDPLKGTYTARTYPNAMIYVEPNFVCYQRLLFEDKNTERYGWTLGPLQTLYSAGQFFSNVSNLPYKFCSFPRLWYDSSAGQCLPGDPVPYLLYPPGLSLTGALGQAGVTVALYAIFP